MMTPKKQRFVDEYLVDLNATQAAIRCGYSRRTARQAGHRLLTDVDVAAEIAKRGAERAANVGITAERVMEELGRVAFSDLRDVVEWGEEGVTLKASKELSASAAAAVAEVGETVTEHGGTKRVKLHNKIDGLRLLGQRMGMFEGDDRKTVVELVVRYE